ncbi:hypothetical protein FA743_10350 [Paracoccus gahaiensis]|uniref:Uncharacterized protein n=1 Tax=Paracoccus gahaiensis TaxID=1706839 RepID=A0A4U0R9L5_9RHOB|nr:hypothetical protein [Paracoccus gahaiensis]TJZ91687.1 hypothetical protein FA743_10350 [Paracoccus gahaiensis]
MSDYLGSLGIVVVSLVLGSGLGLGGALIALETATGDTRGGELLFLGLVTIVGAGLGFVAGLVLAFRWLISRRNCPCKPAA